MAHEALGEHLAVELLEHILVFYILEHDHLKQQTDRELHHSMSSIKQNNNGMCYGIW